jgi:hypothetical protein
MSNGTTTKTKTSTAVKVIVGVAILGLGAYAVANMILPTGGGGITPPPPTGTGKPTITKVATPTNLANGYLTAYQFTVAAPSTNPISLKKVAFFAARTTGVSIAKDPTVPSPGISTAGTVVPTTATMTTSGKDCGAEASLLQVCIRITFDKEYQISAGSSKTFNLSLFIIGARVGSTLGVVLLSDGSSASGSLSGPTPNNGIAGTQYNFLWSPMNAKGHSESTADWYNGAGVPLSGGYQNMAL